MSIMIRFVNIESLFIEMLSLIILDINSHCAKAALCSVVFVSKGSLHYTAAGIGAVWRP